MNIFVTVILAILIYILGGLIGYGTGKTEMCKTLNAEYHNGKCVLVNRKEIKL